MVWVFHSLLAMKHFSMAKMALIGWFVDYCKMVKWEIKHHLVPGITVIAWVSHSMLEIKYFSMVVIIEAMRGSSMNLKKVDKWVGKYRRDHESNSGDTLTWFSCKKNGQNSFVLIERSFDFHLIFRNVFWFYFGKRRIPFEELKD